MESAGGVLASVEKGLSWSIEVAVSSAADMTYGLDHPVSSSAETQNL